jgi:hypothetical protein
MRVATNRSCIFHINKFEIYAEDFRLPACKGSIETYLHYIQEIYVWRGVYNQLLDNVTLMNSSFGQSLLVSILWIFTTLLYLLCTAVYVLNDSIVNQWNVGVYNVIKT